MSVDTFIPEYWAAGLDVPYQENLVYAQTGVANTRFQPMLQNGGRSVTINRLGPVATRKHDRNVPLTYDKLSTTSSELVMDEEEYYGFEVHDLDKAQAAGDFEGPAMTEHARAMSRATDISIGKKLQAGAKTKLGNVPIFDGQEYTRPLFGQKTAWDAMRLMSKELNKQSAPSISRWVVVGAEFGSALLADKHLTEADKAGTDAVARNGLIATISTLGFSVFVSNSVPVVAGREVVIGGVANALDFAAQLQTAEAFRAHDAFGDKFRGLQVWGSILSHPEGVVSLEADVVPGAPIYDDAPVGG